MIVSSKKSRAVPVLFLVPALVYFGALFVYPAYTTVRLSLSGATALNFVQGNWGFVGLRNFRTIFHLAAARTTITNSIIFLVASVVPQLVVGGLLAVALQRRTRPRRTAQALMLVPVLIPTVTIATIFLWIFSGQYGVANWALEKVGAIKTSAYWFSAPHSALIAIILVNIWAGIPWTYLLLQSGLQAIPPELHESATVDGASWFRELVSVTIPLLRESLFAVIMLGLIGTLKVFDFVWIMTQGGPAYGTMLPGILAYQQAFVEFNYGRGSAILMVVTALLTVIAIVYIRLTGRGEDGERLVRPPQPGRRRATTQTSPIGRRPDVEAISRAAEVLK